MDCESDESERWEDLFGKPNRSIRFAEKCEKLINSAPKYVKPFVSCVCVCCNFMFKNDQSNSFG